MKSFDHFLLATGSQKHAKRVFPPPSLILILLQEREKDRFA